MLVAAHFSHAPMPIAATACAQVVREFARLVEDSRTAVADFRGERKPRSGDRLLAEPGALKQRDPVEFEAIKKSLSTLIDEN